jgi:hypothetical protein
MGGRTRQVRLSNHEYYLRRLEKYPDYNSRQARKYKQNHPNKVGKAVDKWCHEHLPAHNAGCNARRLTKLKDHCEICGVKAKILVRHHFDYTKPLEVTTLCAPCHKLVHQVMKAYGFQEPTQYQIELRFCGNCVRVWPTCGRKVPAKRPKIKSCARWQGSEPPEIVLGAYLLEDCLLASNNQGGPQ